MITIFDVKYTPLSNVSTTFGADIKQINKWIRPSNGQQAKEIHLLRKFNVKK